MEKFGNNSIHLPEDEVDEEYQYLSPRGAPGEIPLSSDQNLTPEKNATKPTMKPESGEKDYWGNPAVPKKEESNSFMNVESKKKVVFHIKERTDKKIIMVLDKTEKHGYDSKDFEFTLDHNVEKGDCKLIETTDKLDILLVNDKVPEPWIKMALKRLTRKDVEIK